MRVKHIKCAECGYSEPVQQSPPDWEFVMWMNRDVKLYKCPNCGNEEVTW